MSSLTEQRVTAKNVTMDNCDREQIQYSNAVQPHVVLLVADESTNTVLQASANASELKFDNGREIVGSTLNEIFPESIWQRFVDVTARMKQLGPPVHVGHAEIGGLRDVFVHFTDGLYIVELERQGPHLDIGQSHLYGELRTGIAQLNATTSVVEFLNEAVHIIARCSGFERVMAYRFQGDGSGEVVAEAVQEGLERYLGLHYPASDIPKPARRLFSLTWLRHLPDVDYEPVPILPEINPVTQDAVDLSYAFSRSVSVMYTEYLRNMGVKATMVLTLFKAGRLWGLISCMQHSAPRHLNLEVRGVCEMLAQIISLLMSAKEDAEFASYRESLSACLERLNNELALQPSIADALTTGETTILTAIDATGAAVLLDGEVRLLGKTPPRSEVEQLATQISNGIPDVWSSDRVSHNLDLTPDHSSAAGVLAARIGHFQTDLILWFRPEYRETVSWAGDPSKLVVHAPGRDSRLNPNGSFEVWRSEVWGRAKPWLDCELDFASKLGRGILDVVVVHSRKLAKLNEDLSRSNRELEEFVYTASHDLKTPLRGISGQAQLLLRSVGKQLQEREREKLQDIVRLASHMDKLIEGLLRYSELGQATLVREKVDLNEVCTCAMELLRSEIQQKQAEIRIARPLPTINCDSRWTNQILLNLIGNALKYNDTDSPQVEIGYQDGVQNAGRRRAAPVILYVKDNGIGIAKQHLESIFRLFHRLHSPDQFGGGTGLGLSIVSRAVDRHGGRLWVESEPGKGTTFYLTLSPENDDESIEVKQRAEQ